MPWPSCRQVAKRRHASRSGRVVRLQAHLLLAVILSLVSAAIVRAMIRRRRAGPSLAPAAPTRGPRRKAAGWESRVAFLLGLADPLSGSQPGTATAIAVPGPDCSLGRHRRHILCRRPCENFSFTVKLGAQLAAALARHRLRHQAARAASAPRSAPSTSAGGACRSRQPGSCSRPMRSTSSTD